MEPFSEEALREVVVEYEASKKAALERRDAHLRTFHAAGWRPVDLQRVTGYSRETIRQALRPETRQAVNDNRRRAAARPPIDYVSYGDRKPYVVIESLNELHGPTHGTVTLPRHLDWSGHADYDLDKPARLSSLYRAVLNEAATDADLTSWLDSDTLVRLWPTLWLPERLRRLWEDRFPELGSPPTAA